VRDALIEILSERLITLSRTDPVALERVGYVGCWALNRLLWTSSHDADRGSHDDQDGGKWERFRAVGGAEVLKKAMRAAKSFRFRSEAISLVDACAQGSGEEGRVWLASIGMTEAIRELISELKSQTGIATEKYAHAHMHTEVEKHDDLGAMSSTSPEKIAEAKSGNHPNAHIGASGSSSIERIEQSKGSGGGGRCRRALRAKEERMIHVLNDLLAGLS
jgi:hypothetical protein